MFSFVIITGIAFIIGFYLARKKYRDGSGLKTSPVSQFDSFAPMDLDGNSVLTEIGMDQNAFAYEPKDVRYAFKMYDYF